MDNNKTAAYMANKILQSYCLTMAMLDDYCKQTAESTREHPESIKKRIMASGEKLKLKLIEEISALQK